MTENPFFRDEVMREANALAMEIEALDDERSAAVRERLRELYSSEGAGSFHRLRWRAGVRVEDPSAWSKVGRVAHDGPCYVFADERDCSTVFRCVDGAQVSALIGELGNYTIYVADEAMTFVVCLNQYNELWATGTAILWVRENYESEMIKGEGALVET